TQPPIRWPTRWPKTSTCSIKTAIQSCSHKDSSSPSPSIPSTKLFRSISQQKNSLTGGTQNEPSWGVEFVPYVPDPRTVRDLFSNERREGGLLPRLTNVTTPQVNEPRRQKVFTPPA